MRLHRIRILSSFALATATVCMMSTSASAAPIDSGTDLTFSTRGQSLFGDFGTATHSESLSFDVLNQKNDLLSKGKIQNTQVPLSVATLQAIWQRAIDTCTGYQYTVPVIDKKISPTESECINGEISRKYCVAPPQFGWTYCPDVLGNRKTYVKNLGPGIGSKPTQPTNRAYDLGVIATMTSDMRVGFQGRYEYDLGSVDVDYAAHAQLHVDKDTAAPGDLVTLTTSYTASQPTMMQSRYPSFLLALDMYAYARMALQAEYAGVNESTGEQVHTKKTLYAVDSRNNPSALDGIVPFSNGKENLFSVQADGQGVHVNIVGNEKTVTSTYDYNLTYPFNSPDTPPKKAPRYKYPLSFSLADFSFGVPKLDTPAPFGFNCGDCVPYRNDMVNGTLTNSTPVGARQLLGGITDGNGIVLPLVNDGHEDVDLARVDIDLDAITIAAGAPLGAVVSDPLGLLEAEVNLLDLDLATFLSADQTLGFTPNLEVELRFSTPVELRTAGETDFTTTGSRVIHVGDMLIFKQPSTAVTITPVYTLRDNQFSNVTKLKVSNAIQETLGQVKFGGTIGDAAANLLGQDANFALLQITPTLYDPKAVWTSNTDPWSLQGFADTTGAGVTVQTPNSAGGGSSNGNGNNADSGGGGAFDVLWLCLLGAVLLSTMYRWARRSDRGAT